MPSPWELASAVVLAAFFLFSVFFHGRCKKFFLTALQTFTLGVLIAGMILFIPIFWKESTDGSLPENVVYTFLKSLTEGMRLFLLDIKHGELEEFSLTWPNFYNIFLCVLAPILTFSNVLSFFGSFVGSVRLKLCMLRRVFVMSELSVQSLALAKDIRSRKTGLLPPMIVFASVTEDHPLREQARQLNALCLKREITDLGLSPVGRRVEFFLLGEDESVSVSRATQLRKKHGRKPRSVYVYVYARAAYADSLLCEDPRRKPHLNRKFLRRIRRDQEALFTGDQWMNAPIRPALSLQIFRLDPVDILVKEVLTAKDHAHYKALMPQVPEEEAEEEALLAKNSPEKTISIVVLGLGRYGTHFLKTAAWFYQRNGCRVQIDAFDLGTENGDAEARLKLSCPELFTKNNLQIPGEAACSIRIHKDVDCLSKAFGDRVEKDLKDTDLVFVALGEDDLNIQTAINLRTLFERQGRSSEKAPYIYAVIYDDVKLSNLHAGQMDDCLLAEDSKSNYHIFFVGTLTTQYSYARVEKFLQQEKDALKVHLNWARKERQLHWLYTLELSGDVPEGVDKAACKAFREALDKECGRLGKPLVWYDGTAAPDSTWKRTLWDAWDDLLLRLESRRKGEKAPAETLEANIDAMKASIWEYFSKPYSHNSSIATAEHKAASRAAGYVPTGHFPLCKCLRCEDRRITEHMRWNAYMRACGYIEKESGGKEILAKRHPDLKPLSQLPLREQYKD